MTQPSTMFRAILPAVAAALAALTLGLLGWLWLGATPVDAQEVDCEDVAYNETVVAVCATRTPESGGTPTATPVPTTPPDDDETEDGSDDDPDAKDDDEPSAVTGNGGDRGLIDRGSRGERSGGDLFDLDNEDTSGERPDDDPTDTAETDTGDDPAPSDDDATTDDDTAGVADPGDTATDAAADDGGVYIGALDPAPSNIPQVLAIAAFAVVGSGFVVAARRADQAITSEIGRKIRG